jgi:predicted PurR-regulated permease PerM
MSRSLHVKTIERILPVTVLLAVIMIALLTLYPFLPAILWGGMLAIAVEPRYQWLVRKLDGRRGRAAWLTGIILALLFMIPTIGLARALLAFLPDVFSWLERQAAADHSLVPDPLHQIPAIGPHISALWQSMFSDASTLATHFGDELKAVLLWMLQEIEILGLFVFEFAVGVILAVLLVYHGERVTELFIKFLDRIGGHFAQRMAAHSVLTTRQAVRGVLGAALAQTLVATFSYIVAGIPGWIIWAGLTFILSLVQIGPVLIWLPMSLWLWASGQPLMALFVFLWGLVVVNLTDNIVRPMLVSKDLDLPAILAFLGAVGGLLEWGVVGVFLGPVIVAVGYELLIKWIEPDTLPDETLT